MVISCLYVQTVIHQCFCFPNSQWGATAHDRIKGLEMSLFCCFSSHHGFWSWNELHLLCMWLFILFDVWGLERNWFWSFLARSALWQTLIYFFYHSWSQNCFALSVLSFPLCCGLKNKLLVCSVSMLDMVFT